MTQMHVAKQLHIVQLMKLLMTTLSGVSDVAWQQTDSHSTDEAALIKWMTSSTDDTNCGLVKKNMHIQPMMLS